MYFVQKRSFSLCDSFSNAVILFCLDSPLEGPPLLPAYLAGPVAIYNSTRPTDHQWVFRVRNALLYELNIGIATFQQNITC